MDNRASAWTFEDITTYPPPLQRWACAHKDFLDSPCMESECRSAAWPEPGEMSQWQYSRNRKRKTKKIQHVKQKKVCTGTARLWENGTKRKAGKHSVRPPLLTKESKKISFASQTKDGVVIVTWLTAPSQKRRKWNRVEHQWRAAPYC